MEIPLGAPELVVVDLRTLKLLLPGLAPLMVLGSFEDLCQLGTATGEEPFVWDEDEICP